MDDTENSPSLINILENGQNGLFLDLAFPPGDRDGAVGSTFCIGPFSKTIPGRIKTDGDGVVQHVLLALQRDRYDSPSPLLPVNNIGVETAWINAFTFYQNSGAAKAPIFFKHQVTPKGKFKALSPLFCCHETKRWFHPVCPQCGLTLTLCRDDALLEKRGLPAFSESLDRFLYCGSCATLSGSSPFFNRDKAAGMPDIVHDARALVSQWKQLLAKFPDDTDLPCRGCPDMDVCYGPESLASQRIVPFSFFPFYMMMFPAPSCRAEEFLAIISGDTAAAPWAGEITASPSGQGRFLFQDQDRQFLEILYLKLTFLEQVFRQLMPDEDSAAIQAFDLSLDGIGVDLNPSGAGLPAYWNFNVRILDAVGTVQVSPFAPIIPEAPRLHFLGAVWFRALLVNSRQKTDTVYAEVGRLLDQMGIEKGTETLEIETSDSEGALAGNQIFWSPDPRSIPEKWQVFWKKALRLGFQLVHTGLKTGVAWDGRQFLAALEELRVQIHSEMFSGPVIAATDKDKHAQSGEIAVVLGGILKKWQAEAEAAGSLPAPDGSPVTPVLEETMVFSSSVEQPRQPTDDGVSTTAGLHATDVPDKPVQQPEDNGWEQGGEETVILTSAQAAPPSEARPYDAPGPSVMEPQWNDDGEETVVMRTGAAAPTPTPASPADDMDRTVIISPPSIPPDSSRPGKEEELAATMVQNSPGPLPLSPSGERDGDFEATVVLNTAGSPAPHRGAPAADDDLAATMIQGAGDRRPLPSQGPGISGPPSPDRSGDGDDPEATMVINPASQHPPLNQPPDIPPAQADEEFAATLVQTPRTANRVGSDQPPMKNEPPTPPVPPQPFRGAPKVGPRDSDRRVAPDPANDDDDIMEQTIIIRSDVKKE